MIAAIRLLQPADSIDAITELLHRAYAPLGAMGLNFTGVDQTREQTERRIGRGVCAVALIGERLVGTILAVGGKPVADCRWYSEPHVARAHQFAVEPELHRRGIGGALMRWAEEWAQLQGYRELAVDTAESAEHLVAFYTRRGFRFIEFAQWPGKRYRSVILSKSLPNAPL
jgi:GNAT superfamily N-acetyltransferase